MKKQTVRRKKSDTKKWKIDENKTEERGQGVKKRLRKTKKGDKNRNKKVTKKQQKR